MLTTKDIGVRHSFNDRQIVFGSVVTKNQVLLWTVTYRGDERLTQLYPYRFYIFF